MAWRGRPYGTVVQIPPRRPSMGARFAVRFAWPRVDHSREPRHDPPVRRRSVSGHAARRILTLMPPVGKAICWPRPGVAELIDALHSGVAVPGEAVVED